MIKETIEVNGIPIILEKKKIKNMYLRISPTGIVKISAPLSLPQKNIIEFANSKMDWIIKKRSEILRNPPEPCLRYVSGEYHYLWGKKYSLKLYPKELLKTVLVDDENNVLYLPVKTRTTRDEREKILIEFYRKELKKAIPDILEKAIRIVGREPNEWRVRNMKTRWGSCNINEKRIWLNLHLAKKPKSCLEFVIIHELTHLYEANHGERFKNYMDNFYPNWRETQNILNKKEFDS